jgi:phosphoketolase
MQHIKLWRVSAKKPRNCKLVDLARMILTADESACPRLQGRGHHQHSPDMAVLNDLDRFHLAGDVIDRLPGLGPKAAYVKQALRDKLPETRNWKWTGRGPSG